MNEILVSSPGHPSTPSQLRQGVLGLGRLCGGGCRQGTHLGEPFLSSLMHVLLGSSHIVSAFLSSLMHVLLGSSHIVSAFLHRPLEGGDLYGRANPRVNAIELLAVSPGVLVRHAQILGLAWGEKHALSQTIYHYGVRNANNSLEEIFQ